VSIARNIFCLKVNWIRREEESKEYKLYKLEEGLLRIEDEFYNLEKNYFNILAQ